MRSWSLDDHPILVNFRKMMSIIPHNDGKFYHLFLPPPYALTQKMAQQPLSFVFFTTPQEPTIYHLYGKPNVIVERRGESIILTKGFKNKANIRVFMEMPCTSADGLSFTMYELFTDIYNPKDAPPFCKRILEVYQDPDASYTFLDKEIKNYKELKTLLEGASNYIFVTHLDESNYQDFISRLHVTINKICESVFKLPMCRELPVFVRTKLNYLVFNAITTKCHFQLLKAYHAAYKNQDLIAQKNIRRYELTKTTDIDAAVNILKNIMNLPTPGDCVYLLSHFFDAVVKSFKGKEVAADDILPAICQAMTHDPGFGSHCVSFLTYLADVWPQTGLDEKASYVLVTCSIAAAHLGTPMDDIPETKPEPQPVQDSQPKNRPLNKDEEQVTDSTIDMLNDLLDIL